MRSHVSGGEPGSARGTVKSAPERTTMTDCTVSPGTPTISPQLYEQVSNRNDSRTTMPRGEERNGRRARIHSALSCTATSERSAGGSLSMMATKSCCAVRWPEVESLKRRKERSCAARPASRRAAEMNRFMLSSTATFSASRAPIWASTPQTVPTM